MHLHTFIKHVCFYSMCAHVHVCVRHAHGACDREHRRPEGPCAPLPCSGSPRRRAASLRHRRWFGPGDIRLHSHVSHLCPPPTSCGAPWGPDIAPAELGKLSQVRTFTFTLSQSFLSLKSHLFLLLYQITPKCNKTQSIYDHLKCSNLSGPDNSMGSHSLSILEADII